MAVSTLYPATATFAGDTRTPRWRPLVQWVLAIPQLFVLNALSSLRGVLELVGSVAVIFTGTIPRPMFDAITMTFRYEWRVLSYTFFFDDEYPVFEFVPAADDDGRQRHSALTIAYPTHLNRWKPLYKWLFALPHYIVCAALAVASILTIVWGALAVVVTGRYPVVARQFLVRSYRYALRVQAYVGPLTDQYPPFALSG